MWAAPGAQVTGYVRGLEGVPTPADLRRASRPILEGGRGALRLCDERSAAEDAGSSSSLLEEAQPSVDNALMQAACTCVLAPLPSDDPGIN